MREEYVRLIVACVKGVRRSEERVERKSKKFKVEATLLLGKIDRRRRCTTVYP